MEKMIARYMGKRITEDGYQYLFQSNKELFIEKKDYEVILDDKDSNKTNEQNKKFWATVSEICLEQDGDLKDMDNVYCQILSDVGIKNVVMHIKEEDLDELKKDYRVVKVLDREVVNHISYLTVQCFKGLSKFTKKETAQIIDKALDYLEELKG